MTALAQGTAGLALVMGFALLCVRQIGAAAILLAVQCGAVAVSTVVMHRPILAAPPLLLATGVWFMARTGAWFMARTGAWFVARNGALAAPTVPLGGAKLAIGAGAVLAILCESQAGLAFPLAVILLSVLLAATRQHPLMQLMALVGIQNGIVLTTCFANQPVAVAAPLLAVACFFMPLPLAAGSLRLPMLTQRAGNPATWYGFIDLALSLGLFIATLVIPVDLTASIFAPIIALDGVMRSWQRRNRPAMAPAGRGLALLTSFLLVLAVCPPAPVIAWLAVVAAIMTSLQPALPRLWRSAMMAFLGAGIALCGLLILGPFIPGYFMVFAGFFAIAAVVPDLAVVLVILLLRLANQAPWPTTAQALGIAVSLAALLACAIGLRGKSPRAAVPLLQQSQASVAAFAVCLGQADGRFAALVLLILTILCRAAARVPDGPAASLAIAGLGGVPPLGVFPALVLVVLATISHSPWLLLPLGAATVPILLTSLPSNFPPLLPAIASRPAPAPDDTENIAPECVRLQRSRALAAVSSLGWLPLGLATLIGYFAPEALLRWWHLLTAGQG